MRYALPETFTFPEKSSILLLFESAIVLMHFKFLHYLRGAVFRIEFELYVLAVLFGRVLGTEKDRAGFNGFIYVIVNDEGLIPWLETEELGIYQPESEVVDANRPSWVAFVVLYYLVLEVQYHARIVIAAIHWLLFWIYLLKK